MDDWKTNRRFSSAACRTCGTRRKRIEGWIAYPVTRRVNDPKNDDANLIDPEAGIKAACLS